MKPSSIADQELPVIEPCPKADIDLTEESDSFAPMEYSIHDDMTKGEADYVEQKLVEFADQFTEPRNYREFGVVLRDAEGSAVGNPDTQLRKRRKRIRTHRIPETSCVPATCLRQRFKRLLSRIREQY